MKKKYQTHNVLVIGLNGLGLMPTTPRKARKLLEAHRAKVVNRHPFTIQLLYKTGGATQPTLLGVDTGSRHIGVAVVSDDKVLMKDEHVLRSTMEKRKLMETRKQYRRGRRFRKTPYRHPKFRYCTKRVYVDKPVKQNGHMTHWKKVKTCYASSRPEGWLPPSVQSKCDHHVHIIASYIEALPPSTQVVLELGRFDMQKIKNHDISGSEYQQGRMYEYENVKAYVLAKGGYRCPGCGRKFGSARPDGSIVKARMHHIHYRSRGATNNPDEYLVVCDRCHDGKAHDDGGWLDELCKKQSRSARGMRDMTMMNIVASRLRKAFPLAYVTYGNITAADRKAMRIDKSHANDAVAIAKHMDIRMFGDYTIRNIAETTVYTQCRKKKRSLHEANPRKGRKCPNRGAVRNDKNTKSVNGFALHDKVEVNGQRGWITGFSGKAAYIQNADGQYIHPGTSYKQVSLSKLKLCSHNNNWKVRLSYEW